MAFRSPVSRAASRISSTISVPHPTVSRSAAATRRVKLCSRGHMGVRRQFSVASVLKQKRYTEEHEWIELSPDGRIGTIGITPYASNALGDVIFVELPETGLEVGRGDALGAVESVKSASDILSPIAGKVVETNAALEEKPAQINKDPEGDGWIAKLEVDAKAAEASKELMDAESYKKFTEEAGEGDH